jgi:hypothetical protein
MLPSPNDFLADYLVPVVGVESFNVGIDKNHALAISTWPAAVREARDGYGAEAADLLCDVLGVDADAIVLPYMDPRAGPLLHSNDPAVEAERRKVARTLARDARFDAEVGTWLTVLRAAPGSCT